jgi:transcriptional regulator with GAF, ATPase, and Fis domain
MIVQVPIGTLGHEISRLARYIVARYTGGTGTTGRLIPSFESLDHMWRDILDIQQTKATLAERLRFQDFVADVSTRLITAADDAAGEALTECLRDTCLYFHADRATLNWYNDERSAADLLYFWNEFDRAPYNRLSLENFPWSAPRILTGELVSYGIDEELPEIANRDKATLIGLGIKSVALVPLVVGGQVHGTCTFSNIANSKSWSDTEMSDLKVLAELFGNVVIRLRSHEALKKAMADLERATERLEAENVYLRDEIRSTHGFNELIGESKELIRCLKQVEQVARTGTSVLIQGETGTGKELIARAIHEYSPRSDRPLVKINCAALPASLIESELFGHEKGAFTGAVVRKRGRFDLADGGTIFLDEIGDFPLDLQGKLLRVLQEGEFQRLGSSETVRVDVRVIAATNRNLIDAVDNGEFRADLYYRINTFPIYLPALRERRGDIRLLAEHFVRFHSQQLGKQVAAISSSMLEELENYSWPGNVRQLEGVIQRALISAGGNTLELADSLLSGRVPSANASLAVVNLHGVEKAHILTVLSQCRWMIAGERGAAAMLGLPPSTLRSKMKKLGIVRSQRMHNA